MYDYNPLVDGHANRANLDALVSEKLDDSFTETARTIRHDGWTPARERTFCEKLAETGSVIHAARAADMSAQSAYARRNTAAGRAFHLAWEAALIHARRRLSDELLCRAMNGCVEAVHRNGVIVAEKHRYDNRLSMAVLTRLDRQTEDSRQDATAARVVADEFEQFLDVLGSGADARAFMAARRPADAPRAPSREEALLVRLENYRKFRVGLTAEIDVSDLDPAAMESWSEEQIERADLSGFLARLAPEAWPESILAGAFEEPHGMSQLHQLHRRLHPPKPVASPAEMQRIWEEDGEWWTDFPPPPGFDEAEEGEWGQEDYKRLLSDAELAIVDAGVAEGDAEELAEEEAARDRYFGFRPEAVDEVDADEVDADPDDADRHDHLGDVLNDLLGDDPGGADAEQPLPVDGGPPKAQPCPSSSPSSPG